MIRKFMRSGSVWAASNVGESRTAGDRHPYQWVGRARTPFRAHFLYGKLGCAGDVALGRSITSVECKIGIQSGPRNRPPECHKQKKAGSSFEVRPVG